MTDVYRVDVEITAPVYDTEVTSRVADAITNIFPNAELEESFGEIRAETHSMDHFSDLLHRQEILDTARGEFFSNRDGNVFSFALKNRRPSRTASTSRSANPTNSARSAFASASRSRHSRSTSTTSRHRPRTDARSKGESTGFVDYTVSYGLS